VRIGYVTPPGSVANFASLPYLPILAVAKPMISFKGVHFPKDVILYALFFIFVMEYLTAI